MGLQIGLTLGPDVVELILVIEVDGLFGLAGLLSNGPDLGGFTMGAAFGL